MSGPFHPSAHLYDLVYSHLDYGASAAYVEDVIRTRNPGASSLLDVACGTGVHLGIWRERFDPVAGMDLDDAMLAVARERVPGVEFVQGDFTDFDLGRTFDAVTCMFSSIGYAHTPERLDATVASMARHLAPGGVLVVEPWLRRSMLHPPSVRLLAVERDDVVLARTSRMTVVGETSDMEFGYLITTEETTEFFTERHVMGLHEPDRYLAAATRAGLSAEFDPVGSALGRGMLIAVRPGGEGPPAASADR